MSANESEMHAQSSHYVNFQYAVTKLYEARYILTSVFSLLAAFQLLFIIAESRGYIGHWAVSMIPTYLALVFCYVIFFYSFRKYVIDNLILFAFLLNMTLLAILVTVRLQLPSHIDTFQALIGSTFLLLFQSVITYVLSKSKLTHSHVYTPVEISSKVSGEV